MSVHSSGSEIASTSPDVPRPVSGSLPASAPVAASVSASVPAQAAGHGRGRGQGQARGREAAPPGARVADPVRELMHRHWELCARAVDPLEIAAALEAQGATDRVAARYRHRDVFSLAEELFARAPGAEERCLDGPYAPGRSGRSDQSGQTGGTEGSRPGRQDPAVAAPVVARAAPRMLLPLLAVVPGVVCAAAVAVAAVSTLPGAAGAPAVSAPSPGAVRTGVAVAAGLACALVPAVRCARWFAVRAGRRLELSRSLGEFASGVRPLLTAALVLFTGALAGLLLAVRGVAVLAAPPGAVPTAALMPVLPVTAALGVLLFAALLLVAYGFHRVAASGLGAACVLQALAPAAGSASGSVSPYAVAAGCACAALFLLACAYRLLGRASAYPARAERRSRRRRGCCRGRPEHRERRTCREQWGRCDDCDRCDHCDHGGDDGHDGHDGHVRHDGVRHDGHCGGPRDPRRPLRTRRHLGHGEHGESPGGRPL